MEQSEILQRIKEAISKRNSPVLKIWLNPQDLYEIMSMPTEEILTPKSLTFQFGHTVETTNYLEKGHFFLETVKNKINFELPF